MRRGNKPCENCEDWWQHNEHVGSTSLTVEFYPEQGFIAVSAIGANENTGEMEEAEQIYDINYCPFCGRKLH